MNNATVSTTPRAEAHASNFIPWCMMIGGILLMPFTSGLSFGATLLGGFMLRSPDPAQPDTTVNDMQLVAEQATTGSGGCTGCLFSWLTILTCIIGLFLFAVCVMAAAGGGA